VFEVKGEKFLGFMFTHHGIEANHEKCRAITEMRSPENVKKIQRLIERLTTLSRFMPKLAERTKPIVQLLRKATRFQWMDECERIFLQLKSFLASPPVIQKLNSTEPITIYLVVSKDVISATLVQEIEKEE